MSTTTIRLTADLRSRVLRAAEKSGKTAHAFIVDAVAEKTDETERRQAFLEVGGERYAAIVKTGKTVAWSEARTYLEARLAGRKARRPVAKKRK